MIAEPKSPKNIPLLDEKLLKRILSGLTSL